MLRLDERNLVLVPFTPAGERLGKIDPAAEEPFVISGHGGGCIGVLDQHARKREWIGFGAAIGVEEISEHRIAIGARAHSADLEHAPVHPRAPVVPVTVVRQNLVRIFAQSEPPACTLCEGWANAWPPKGCKRRIE